MLGPSSAPTRPVAAAPTASAAPGTATSAGLTAIVAVLSLAVFMASLDLFIVNLAFPSITRAYPGTGLGGLSWVLNAYTIVFAAVLVPSGRWADRLGRRRLLIIGLLVFAAGSAACGLAPGVPWLIAARVVQAVGAGLMVPASLSLVLAAAPAAGRARALGTWSAFGALGAALGPVIGGGLVEISWRWVFWVNLPVAVVAVVAAARVLPESRDEHESGRPDLAGAAVLAAAVGLVAYALVEAPSWGWTSGAFAAALAGGAVLVVALVLRSARHPAPVLELGLLRSRRFSGALGASILYYAGFGAFVLNSVEFLTGVWHYSPVRAGLAIAPGPLMVLPVARLLAPRLTARLGSPGAVAVLGCALNAAAQLLWLLEIQTHPAYVTHLLPAQILGGAGVGLTIPSLLGAGTANLPAGRFGTGSGILNMGRQIGTVLGVAVLVALLAPVAGGDPLDVFRHGVLFISGTFAAAGVAAAAMLVSARRPAASEPGGGLSAPGRAGAGTASSRS